MDFSTSQSPESWTLVFGFSLAHSVLQRFTIYIIYYVHQNRPRAHAHAVYSRLQAHAQLSPRTRTFREPRTGMLAGSSLTIREPQMGALPSSSSSLVLITATPQLTQSIGSLSTQMARVRFAHSTYSTPNHFTPISHTSSHTHFGEEEYDVTTQSTLRTITHNTCAHVGLKCVLRTRSKSLNTQQHHKHTPRTYNEQDNQQSLGHTIRPTNHKHDSSMPYIHYTDYNYQIQQTILTS